MSAGTKPAARGRGRPKKVQKAAEGRRQLVAPPPYPVADPDGYISVLSFARYFGISTQTVYRMIERQEIEHIRVGRVIRLPAGVVEQYTQQRTVGVKALTRK